MDVDSGQASCRLRVGPIQEDTKHIVRFEECESKQRGNKFKNGEKKSRKESNKENAKDCKSAKD